MSIGQEITNISKIKNINQNESVVNLAEPDSDDATYVDEESIVSDHHTTKQPQHCFHVSNWLSNILGLTRIKGPIIEQNSSYNKAKISIDLMDGSPSPPLVQRLAVTDPSAVNGHDTEILTRERTQSQPIPISSPSKQLRSLSFEQAISSSTPIMIKPRTSNNTGETGHEDVPPAYVDERDGHIWRAKYCVLENGVLYFYRNEKIGNSVAAQNERDRKLRIYQSENAKDQIDASFAEKEHLAKSPMPRNFMHLHPNYESGVSSKTHPLLSAKEKNGGGSFCFDPNVYWEKRVPLDMVGSVRTSPSFGDSTFELLALNSSNGINGDEKEDSSVSDDVDKLILRAPGGVDDVNSWIFEIHRSFVFLLREMAGYVGSHSGKSKSNLTSSRAITPTPASGGSDMAKSLGVLSYMQAARNGVPNSASNSPTTYFIPSFASMSHGHGRRRRHEDGTLVDDEVASSSPTNSDNNRLSSPILFYQRQRSKSDDITDDSSSSFFTPKVEFPLSRIPITKSSARLATSDVSENQSLTPSLNKLDQPIVSPVPAANKVGKYVHPHLRGATAKKYIPPHLRNTSPVQPVPFSTARHVSLDVKEEEIDKNKFVPISDQFEEATSSSEFLHSEGFGIVDDEIVPQNSDEVIITSNPPIFMKLGGCADPSLIVGSICDSQYIPTKMSKVGKTIAPSYGHVGETFEIGAVSRCGVRDSNEDAYLILFDLLRPVSFDPSESFFSKFKTHSLFAIFDGHCGNHAARYAAEKFHDILMDESRNLDYDPNKSTEDILHYLLSLSIDRLDRDFCHFCTQDGREWFSGSTAIISLMVDDHIAVAGVGDASGVICCTSSSPLSQLRSDGWNVLDPEDEDVFSSDGLDIDNDSITKYTVYKEVADAHSPSHPDEKHRIEASNGWITYETEIPLISQFHRMNWADKDVLDIFQRCFSERFSEHHSNPSRILKISRVCGDLAVSRALGDREYKAAFNKDANDTTLQGNEWRSPAPMPFYEYNMQKGKEHSGLFTGDLVISTPGVKHFRVGTHGTEEFMLIACDGLWDVIDHDEAVRVTRNLLFQIKLSTEECAERLAELAGGLGSSDNVTIIVVKFKEPKI